MAFIASCQQQGTTRDCHCTGGGQRVTNANEGAYQDLQWSRLKERCAVSDPVRRQRSSCWIHHCPGVCLVGDPPRCFTGVLTFQSLPLIAFESVYDTNGIGQDPMKANPVRPRPGAAVRQATRDQH
jgi:hypothetical protein